MADSFDGVAAEEPGVAEQPDEENGAVETRLSLGKQEYRKHVIGGAPAPPLHEVTAFLAGLYPTEEFHVDLVPADRQLTVKLGLHQRRREGDATRLITPKPKDASRRKKGNISINGSSSKSRRPSSSSSSSSSKSRRRSDISDTSDSSSSEPHSSIAKPAPRPPMLPRAEPARKPIGDTGARQVSIKFQRTLDLSSDSRDDRTQRKEHRKASLSRVVTRPDTPGASSTGRTSSKTAPASAEGMAAQEALRARTREIDLARSLARHMASASPAGEARGASLDSPDSRRQLLEARAFASMFRRKAQENKT